MHLIAHFTILDGKEDGVDLVLIQPLLRSYVNLVVLLLTSIFKHNVHTKTKKVCIITRSTSASHSLEGQGTKPTTVKWFFGVIEFISIPNLIFSVTTISCWMSGQENT